MHRAQKSFFHILARARKARGFTIVDLLIIIGILSAITIATYRGVQGCVYDIAVSLHFTDSVYDISINNPIYLHGSSSSSTRYVVVALSKSGMHIATLSKYGTIQFYTSP